MTLPLKIRGFTLTKRFVHDIFLHLDDVSPYILGFDFVAMIECILHPDHRVQNLRQCRRRPSLRIHRIRHLTNAHKNLCDSPRSSMWKIVNRMSYTPNASFCVGGIPVVSEM